MDTNIASYRRGIYTFRVLGQVFHTFSPLTPHEGKSSHFQLYFWDSCNKLTNRMDVFDNADICEDTMKLLIDFMKKNPYAELLNRINDFPSIEHVTLQICKNAEVDQRCYNNPTADQVAAIWVEGNNPNIPYDRDILLHGTDGHKHIVKHYFGCYDPLKYPFLFPNGENGWHQNIPKFKDASIVLQSHHVTVNLSDFSSMESILQTKQRVVRSYNNRMVSCRDYYCYKFQIRNQNPSVVLYERILLQQYAVYMYIKLETTHLDYCRNNQAELRSEYYQGIVDSVTCGEIRGSEIGKRIVLLESLIGGPRDMRKIYLDAMALVRRFGKPDLFITMTCNPKWKEVTDNLVGSQQPQDHHDLTARVFRSKVQGLKKEITHKAIFGLVAAYAYVVEFQKRGLPHIHMLIILKQSYKINNADQFHDYVSTELPNKEENPRLFDLVTHHMMHGPYGYLNRTNSCMIAGQCKCNAPKI
ncbi:uncharacterized protein LOC142509527 [Primulina tabacum]|uniref:uncharacterized protein LOC142509527 n=1 Tax=Primulina tabacum TaxID=48773 RepID=UPI003F59E7DD